jgi:hypothetical protein
MIFKKFLYAIAHHWSSLVTGGLSIPITILALFTETPTLRALWAIFALACFGYTSFRVWADEYRRAESAEGKLATIPRPWVVVDGYEGFYAEAAETGQEHLAETVRIVNRGDATAVSIDMPSVQFGNRSARILTPLPTLGPGESIEIQIINLHRVMEAVKAATPTIKDQSWSACLPLTIRYRDPKHANWETNQAIIYTVMGINFSILHPNEPQESRKVIAGTP